MQRRVFRPRQFLMPRTARPSQLAGNAVQEQYLGELPEDFLSERALREPMMSPMIREFAPGTSPLVGPTGLTIPVPANNYKSAMYPFITQAVSTKVVPANPYRAYLLIQNRDGAGNSIFVNFGADATSVNAIEVVDQGNLVFEGGAKGGVFCPLEDVYIVGAIAGSNCLVMEGLSYTP